MQQGDEGAPAGGRADMTNTAGAGLAPGIDRKAFVESMRLMRRSMARDFLLSALAALDEGDITLAQMATLMTLDGGASCSVKALAERLGRSLSATSRLIDQLVKRRLLRRTEDPEDRRGKLITLAPAGKRLVEELMDRRAEAYLQLAERLPAKEQAVVARAMALLAKAAGRSP
jgi:DNA-binding MarR family transcriptional regulator